MAAGAEEGPIPMPPKEPAAAAAAGGIVPTEAVETGCMAGEMEIEELVGMAEMAPVPAPAKVPVGAGAEEAAPAPTPPRVPVAAGVETEDPWEETGPPGGGRWAEEEEPEGRSSRLPLG